MPEWLRLFKPKTMVSAIREIAPTVEHTAYFNPRFTPILKNTYFLPTFTLNGAIKKMYNSPIMSVFGDTPYDLSDSIYSEPRDMFRLSLGIPQGFTLSSPLTASQARNILHTGASSNFRSQSSDFNRRLNLGLRPGDPRELDYASVLHYAGDTYADSRRNTPYNSVQEFLNDVPLFSTSRTRMSHPVVLDAAVNAYASGMDLEDIPEFSGIKPEATRMAFNLGIIDKNHPDVQRLLEDETYVIPSDPEYSLGNLGVNAFRSAGLRSSSQADDASYAAVKRLGSFASRYLTTPEKLKLLAQALPDGISLEDLTPDQIKELKKIIRPDSGVGNMISRRYDKSFLDTMANLDSIPEEERAPIMEAINSAYRAPASSEYADPYAQLLMDRYAEEFKNFGIDVTPEELKIAFDVYNPRYPEVSAKLRAKGFEILPGDIQHMSWFQMQNANDAAASWEPDVSSSAFDNWTKEQKDQFIQRAREIVAPIIQSQALIRTGIQARALEQAMPRGTGVFEVNTSPDSYKLNLKTAVTSPLYGFGPGKIRLWPLSEKGNATRMFGNNLQLNRLWFDENGNAVSSLGLPGVQQNPFTRSQFEELFDIFNNANSIEDIKTTFEQNPEIKGNLMRILNSAKAIKEHDRNSAARVFDIANKKNRTLGLPEFNLFPSIEIPIYPDQERFYDNDNILAIRKLLRDMSAMSSSFSNGWAPYMRRIPMGSLKQKRGGKIPNWTKRYIQ